MSKSRASERKRSSKGAGLLRSAAQNLLGGSLARYSPLLRYFAVGLWVYRRLKKRSAGQRAKFTLKPGDAFEIRSKPRK
ncbi:MAG: hypothetical protein M0Z47_08850 [Actinomycetota bacterium]|nr:hypothetical protein [Actinomycetota bacterium]